ncbi:putative gag-polypeptide of LTR copia-type [Rosa chinensis]|uniref:Putative gag-polypeptide of LTR copia-type n=1 Tax=Rosa chinensis TaxID=74649 RepID=A0A2P6Q5B6_ROSCH|nr:putative gag-polypeptide of LTR copia-type [Rosa chinensis]
MTGGSSIVDTETVSVTSSPTSEVEGNPNQRLCSVVLNEFNYLPWSRAVTLALGGRSKLSFINGSLEAPDITSPM